MASAGWALQTRIYETLIANAALVGLLGGPRVFDDAPRDAAFPYVTFGNRPWPTGARGPTRATSI